MNSSIAQLLLSREINALHFTIIVRSIVLIFFGSSTFFVAQNNFEILTTSLILSVSFLVNAIMWIFHKKPIVIRTFGFTGVLLDLIFIWTIPFVWYNAVGGELISRAYILKTSVIVVAIIPLIVNSFTLRYEYPLIISFGVLVLNIFLYYFAANDSRFYLSDKYVDHMLSSAVKFEYYFTGAFTHFSIGLLMSFFAYRQRKIISEVVNLEQVNFQLGRYFSPQIMNQISNADPNFLRPGGSLKKVVILFSDIRGFTSLSEKLDPQEVVQFLSEYHSRMVRAIFKYSGSLDKFIGDGIMATFGIIEFKKEDISNAILASLEMRKELKLWNESRIQENKEFISQGIGIHFGPAICGNIGTENRLEYTVIGDTVNIASRIESACKELKTDILVSESVYREIHDQFPFIDFGEIFVKGKEQPLHLYGLKDS